ncbi:hypothetical protein ZIOFF_063483 [Zingiber officinale]|uniref:Uncharacterized protein n=1 Tax=Zingiber officinale TaxID=94328 RepID=A0A8J5F2J4_ZINOF|nr:hypothetical protein ZIOFF_063483 [Zingiber officinale]
MADKVAVGVADDMGESVQCVDHPYRSNPGGVCAFCLQEKLGKLVSSSKSNPFLPLQPSPSSSTSSPTSFRADVVATGLASVYSRNGAPAYDGRRTKFSYLAVGRSKKKKGGGDLGSYANGGRKFVVSGSSHTTASVAVANGGGLVLKRSKSVAPTPRTTGSFLAQVGAGRRNGDAAVADSPRKKSFWSFLYHSPVSSAISFSSAVNGNSHRRRSTSSSSGGGCEGDASKQHPQPPSIDLEAETGRKLAENSSAEDAQSPSGSQASSSFGRKVSRSRSVGCGSRSFSGDFLERISTGFGDCTLRRVESQREAKPKTAIQLDQNKNNDGDRQHTMKETIKCGGIFGGLGMMSAYWLPAAADDDYDIHSRASASTPAARTGVAPHGRTRTWGLALASPMRAFRPHSSSSRSLYTINAAASTGPAATNIISSTNGHDGCGKQSSLNSDASFLASESDVDELFLVRKSISNKPEDTHDNDDADRHRCLLFCVLIPLWNHNADAVDRAVSTPSSSLRLPCARLLHRGAKSAIGCFVLLGAVF